MSEDSIEFSLSIAEQRAVGFIPAWSLAFLQRKRIVNNSSPEKLKDCHPQKKEYQSEYFLLGF